MMASGLARFGVARSNPNSSGSTIDRQPSVWIENPKAGAKPAGVSYSACPIGPVPASGPGGIGLGVTIGATVGGAVGVGGGVAVATGPAQPARTRGRMTMARERRIAEEYREAPRGV